jgi:hypothetical protein
LSVARTRKNQNVSVDENPNFVFDHESVNSMLNQGLLSRFKRKRKRGDLLEDERVSCRRQESIYYARRITQHIFPKFEKTYNTVHHAIQNQTRYEISYEIRDRDITGRKRCFLKTRIPLVKETFIHRPSSQNTVKSETKIS